MKLYHGSLEQVDKPEIRNALNLNVTQDNLYLFLPSKISWMADMLSEDKHVSIADAIKEIYASDTYRHLENEETKYWHLGPVALYENLKQVNPNNIAKWKKWSAYFFHFSFLFRTFACDIRIERMIGRQK